MHARAQHIARIEQHLSDILSMHDAREAAARIGQVAFETDVEISRILEDPLVKKLYEYDGRIFTTRSGDLFHTAFDGLRLLESLSASRLQSFFLAGENKGALERLLDHVSMHAWVAKARRMNWEEFGSLGLVAPDALERLAVRSGEPEPPPLFPEEREFFERFESQLRSQPK